MPYIGHSPEVAQRRYESIDDISGSFNGSTTSFALQVGGVTPAPFPVASENVLISVGGVIQEPDGTGTNGFQLTGTNIVFSSAPAAGQSFFGVILAGADYVTAGHAFPDGDAAGPSITFSQDLDTGVFRAGSGAIGFGGDGSERARLDGSGRLLVGTTTARAAGDVTAPLQVEGTGFNTSSLNLISNAGASAGNVSHISLAKSRGTSDGSSTVVAEDDNLGTIQWCGADGTDLNSSAASISASVDAAPGSNDMPGRITFGTTANGSASPTERARIDSSGRLMLGDTSDSSDSLLIVQGNAGDSGTGGQISVQRGGNANPTSPSELGNIAFKDSAASRGAVISAVCDGDWASNDFPGRLEFKVTADGESSPTERLRLGNQAELTLRPATYGMGVRSVAGSSSVNTAYFGAHSSTSMNAGTITFEVYTNGNVKNTNNSYGQLSDVNLKENIVDATSQWDDIKSLQIRKYNFREATGYDTHTQIGLVAQEVETVCPGLVQETPVREDATPVLDAEGNELEATKSVLTSVLYMKAVKALQEAQTRIEALETQNTAQQTTIDTLQTQNTAQQTTIDDLLARVTALEAA